jgi:hypothetical protein
MTLEKSGKIVSLHPALTMLLGGDAVFYTTQSAKLFVMWDPEICNLYGYENMI